MINELDGILEVLTDLFSWRDNMYLASDLLLSRIKKQHDISKALKPSQQLIIYYNETPPTLHPKKLSGRDLQIYMDMYPQLLVRNC